MLSPWRPFRQGMRPHAACGEDGPADAEASVNYQERLWVPISPAVALDLGCSSTKRCPADRMGRKNGEPVLMLRQVVNCEPARGVHP
jgi:hypothetical protein